MQKGDWETGRTEEDVVGKEGLQAILELFGDFLIVKTPVNHT